MSTAIIDIKNDSNASIVTFGGTRSTSILNDHETVFNWPLFCKGGLYVNNSSLETALTSIGWSDLIE